MTYRVKHIGASTVQWDDRDPMPVPKGCERREPEAVSDAIPDGQAPRAATVAYGGALFLAGILG